MIYISIDLETTGLDPEYCQILSFGAIVEDTNNLREFKDLPKFHAILVRDRLVGEPFALNMNSSIIKDSIDKTREDVHYITEYELATKFYEFLIRTEEFKEYRESREVIRFNVAGKNFGTFDKNFLDKLPEWKRLFSPRQRVLDPGILGVDFKNDDTLPNLDKMKQKLGLVGEVSHDAVEDAWDVIQVLRKYY